MRLFSALSPGAVLVVGATHGFRVNGYRATKQLQCMSGLKAVSHSSSFSTSTSTSTKEDSAGTKATIALCQLMVGSDKQINIENARQMLESSVKKCPEITNGRKLDIAVLPEVWNSPYSTSSFPVYAEPVPEVGGKVNNDADSPSTAMLVNEAKTLGIWLVGGSIPERCSKGNLYNTCLVINPKGEIVGKHRKVHLFDIDVPGKMTFKESDSLSAGNSVTTVYTPWGSLGVGICYDIRFPELSMLMRNKGCNLLIFPGAFNMVTGPAHWELLQRARAVDNQLFVAACSPARNESSNGYIAWGHSSVVNPWGEVIAKAGAFQETVFATMEFDQVTTMRQNIPCSKQKRNDIYSLQQLK
jgi:omega-amidase